MTKNIKKTYSRFMLDDVCFLNFYYLPKQFLRTVIEVSEMLEYLNTIFYFEVTYKYMNT